jgi:hypothetical protein
VVFAQALKPFTRKELGMRMTKDDVLAFREGQRVHLLRSHKNATIAERKEILDADGTRVVGVDWFFDMRRAVPSILTNSLLTLHNLG